MILVAVCGLPGAGKTTVAERVAARLDAELLRTDVIRKEILSDPQYTEEETRMVYGELCERARRTIEAGRNVVLDATFYQREFRRDARAVAEQVGAEFELIHVVCDEDVVERRIANREEGKSDADFSVYLTHKEIFQSVEIDHVTVDNSGSLDETERQIDDVVGMAPRS